MIDDAFKLTVDKIWPAPQSKADKNIFFAKKEIENLTSEMEEPRDQEYFVVDGYTDSENMWAHL
jgi:hypothetical protein